MRPILSLIRSNAALFYFGLVFLISWGGGFLILGPGHLPLSPDQFANLGLPFYLAIIAGPSVAGILMIAVADGMPGIREFLARLRRWRVAPIWYAAALVPALAIVGASSLLWLASPELGPGIFGAEHKRVILVAALVPSLLVGGFEEIGWTGFATPRLRARHSIVTTALVIGVVWGAWHFPLFWEADSFTATLPFTVLLARLFAWLPPFRVLLIRIHERTRSLPVVMLMHAAVSFVSIAFASQGLSGARLLTGLLASAATMWTLVAAAGIAERRMVVDRSLSPKRPLTAGV